jgi:hypothetical protein
MRKTSIARGHRDGAGGFGHRPPTSEQAMRSQCLGSLTEAIVRKGLNIDAPLTHETFNVADLPGGIQVRCIGVEHYGLRVYARDDLNWKVVGVVVPKGMERVSPYRIPGWIYAGDAQRDEWLIAPNDGPPMWAAPQAKLSDARELTFAVSVLI